MNRNESLTSKWGLVSSLTLFSRLVGYARDVLIAYLFGASYQTDAFYVAFRIPNLLRRLFAEGSLTVAFIPIFTDYIKNKGKESAGQALNSIFTMVFIAVALISIIGILLSPIIVNLFAYGFDRETYELTVTLNRIMFPYILFISIAALSMGVLNTINHFFAPAVSPVVFNLTIICSAYFLYGHLHNPTISLAIGVLIGGFLQLVVNIPFLISKGYLFGFTRRIFHPAVKRLGLLITPQLFGLAVYNVNILVNTQFASYMPTGTVSYLYFSERLIEFPLGIVAVSIATVLLPTLADDVKSDDFPSFRNNFKYMLRLMLFVIVPALVGLAILRVPICSVLFQRGEFTYHEVLQTSSALLGYSLGVWAVGGLRITVPAFYSMEDTKTPVIVGFFAFIINAVSCYILGFVFSLNQLGLALASTISSIFNFLLLLYLIDKKVKDIFDITLLRYFLKVMVMSVVTGLVALYISSYIDWSIGGVDLVKLAVLATAVIFSGMLYFLMARILGFEELDELKNIVIRKNK